MKQEQTKSLAKFLKQLKLRMQIIRRTIMGQNKEWDWKLLTPAAVAVVVSIVLILMSVQPKRYDLQMDDVAPETSKATREIEDTVSTQKLIDEAVAAVDVRYTEDEQAMADTMSGMDAFAESCRMVRETAADEVERWRQQELNKLVAAELERNPDSDVTTADFTVDTAEFVYEDSFLQSLARMLPAGTTAQQVRCILDLSNEDLEVYCRILTSCVEATMKTGVKESLLSSAYDTIMADFTASLPSLNDDLRALALCAVRQYVKANLLLDTEALEAARQRAIESVTPVTFKSGEIIVEEGKRITEAQYEVLKSLNLLRSDRLDWSLYLSTIGFVVLTYGLLAIYIVQFHRTLLKDREHLWMICAQFCVVMVVSYLCQLADIRLAPVAACGIVVTVALRERIGLAVAIAASFLVGMMAGEGGQIVNANTLNVTLATAIGGCVSVFILRSGHKQIQRGTMLVSGALGGVVTAGIYFLVARSQSTGNYLPCIAYGIGSGVLSGMLCLGVMPFWENLFGLLTPMKLMELSNPNQPLLKKLLMEASGTYHHSIVVANLAEQAADAIGADGLFARTAAYYHDVGKMKRPVFSKENQVGPGNPHDHISPDLSAMILRSHVTDGVAIAKRYRIPRPIQNVIRSHHGDTLAAFFYGKASKLAQEQGLPPVNEASFRYPGPRPETKEEAVIMLADTIEAASRTLREHTPEAIRELVEKLVRGKLADGQLDDSPLTLRDLGILIESFIKTLSSTYHERIEYPDLPKSPSASSVSAQIPVQPVQAPVQQPMQNIQIPQELQEE